MAKFWVSFVVFIGATSWSTISVFAQGGGEWTFPEPISPETEHASYPALAVDTSGTVHAFWFGKRIEQDEPEAILYARYEDGEWTQPIDILLSPGGQSANFPRAVLDNTGRIHLVWSGPGTANPFGALYHSWAFVDEAHSVHGWQPPSQIAEGTYQSDIGVDPQGKLHIVYASVNDSQGICHVSSEDSGDVWSERVCIPHFNPLRDQETEVRPRLAIDSQGYLHVVWVLDDYSPRSQLRYSGRAVYYARSTDSGASWSELTAIDEVDGRGKYTEAENGLQPEWSTITVDSKDRVHILWVGNPNMSRYHQWSGDGGITWSQRQEAISIGGYNGWMGAVADSDDRLHFISPSLRGLAYNRWTEAGWGSPILLEQAGWAPHYADAVVVLGNELHAVWQSGQGASASEDQRIMHAMLQTGSQGYVPRPVPIAPLSIQPTPTPTSTPLNTLEETPTRIATPATRGVDFDVEATTIPSSPLTPLLLGLVPVVALIGFIILFRGIRKS